MRSKSSDRAWQVLTKLSFLATHPCFALARTQPLCCVCDASCVQLSCRQSQQRKLSLCSCSVAGNNDWVSTLANGRASEHTQRSQGQPKVSVPRPAALHGRRATAPGPAARKPRAAILAEAGGYAREQCAPSAHIPDAAAQRLEDQMMFEHGKARLQEMQQMGKEAARAKQVPARPADPHAEMMDQVCLTFALAGNGCTHVA